MAMSDRASKIFLFYLRTLPMGSNKAPRDCSVFLRIRKKNIILIVWGKLWASEVSKLLDLSHSKNQPTAGGRFRFQKLAVKISHTSRKNRKTISTLGDREFTSQSPSIDRVLFILIACFYVNFPQKTHASKLFQDNSTPSVGSR